MATGQDAESAIGPLHEQHLERGAKLVDFAGWLMPIEYDGVLKEHQRVRETVGVFDVSHMGTVRLVGQAAVPLANAAFALDVSAVEPGRAAYGLCLNEDGGAIDDLLVYVKSATELMVVPNASNAHLVISALEQVKAADPALAAVTIADVAPDTAILAVQGPKSGEVLAALDLPTNLDYMSFVELDEPEVAGFKLPVGSTVTVARSGYTGEFGFELIVPSVGAVQIWKALCAAAEAVDGGPAGLGARDTLRLEMGYPLHGQELAPDRIATTAPVGWTVGWDKPNFVGKDVLIAAKAAGPERKLVGLRMADRGIPRDGMAVVVAGSDGQELGVVTSGTFSPTLKTGIALALIDASGLADDLDLAIDVRGRECAVERVSLPFVDSNPREVPA